MVWNECARFACRHARQPSFARWLSHPRGLHELTARYGAVNGRHKLGTNPLGHNFDPVGARLDHSWDMAHLAPRRRNHNRPLNRRINVGSANFLIAGDCLLAARVVKSLGLIGTTSHGKPKCRDRKSHRES